MAAHLRDNCILLVRGSVKGERVFEDPHLSDTRLRGVESLQDSRTLQKAQSHALAVRVHLRP